MKKIVSMVLLVCMILCGALPLSSCSKSPAAVVTAAMIRTGKLDSYVCKQFVCKGANP